MPDPYYISAFEEERTKTVSLQPGDETTLYFENQRRPVIEILKLNEVTLDPISDVPFQVWYAPITPPPANITILVLLHRRGRPHRPG